MHSFARKLITEWRRLGLPVEGQTVVVAVSGGADSLSLLLALDNLGVIERLRNRVVAAHFNHKIRGSASDADQRRVAEITSNLGIELAVGYGSIKTAGNIEESARNQRYSFLTETAKKLNASIVLTAHTVNDQAETFLINLLRGSGVRGLSGMKPVRPLVEDRGLRIADSAVFGKSSNSEFSPDESAIRNPQFAIKLVRPLLTWAKRAETETFCRDLNVEYCHDTMNEDTAFKRVRIRKVLLPLLQDFNPNIIEVLANTAFLLGNADALAETGNRNAASDEIDIWSLRDKTELEACNTIRGWLTRMRGNSRRLGLKHIKAVARLALSTKSGRLVEVPGGRVTKTGGRLRYGENEVEKKRSDN